MEILTDSDCGNPNRADPNKRIVGGEKAEVGEYPWQVAILFTESKLKNQGCGGSLVGDKYVVTAAHCTAGQSASSLFVRHSPPLSLVGIRPDTVF